MIWRTEAYCCQCQASIVRVWASEPLDLKSALCLVGQDHHIEFRSEAWETIGTMNASYMNA